MYQIKMILLMASEYKEKITNNCPLQVFWLTMQNGGRGDGTITYKTSILRNLEKEKSNIS